MQEPWEVIIIGAGISGLAASRTLAQASVPHLVLESRNRIGGRICAESFSGEQIDYGATFIHYPQEPDQEIAKIVKQIEWPCFSAEYDLESFMLEGHSELTPQQVAQVYQSYWRFISFLKKQTEKLYEDVSLAKIAHNFFTQQFLEENSAIRLAVEWLIREYANIQGSQLQNISAQNAEFKTLRKDIIPQGGFPKLIEALFKDLMDRVIFSQVVVKIDFSNKQFVHIQTTEKTYKAAKVISSLPLGVLKSGKVIFQPPLPQAYVHSINKLGVGVFNKLFVTFQAPFWRNMRGWLHMVQNSSDKQRYPQIFILPQHSKPTICVQISGQASRELSQLQDEEVIRDFQSFLKKFVKEDIVIKDYKMTRWHQDQHSLGSYCYFPVGTTHKDFQAFGKPIDNRIWFIGEHTHPEKYATTHGAFETGIRAAQEVANRKYQ